MYCIYWSMLVYTVKYKKKIAKSDKRFLALHITSVFMTIDGNFMLLVQIYF